MSGTSIESKSEILGELWLNYSPVEKLQDFTEYNDVGLPLAFACSQGLAEPTEDGAMFISETFNLLLAALEKEDTGFGSLDELLES